MKRLYEEYLHVPEEGKVREKVFIGRIVVAIVCMVCCLSAMGFSAYAYFTSSITSGSNIIQAATYGVEVTIAPSVGAAIEANTDNSLLYENIGSGTYVVTLKATGTATTGYCKIEITGSEKTVTLFTQQMAPKENMSFTLVLNGGANIIVTPQWGTYSNRSVVVGNGSTQEILLVAETDANASATESDTSATDTNASATNSDGSATNLDASETETDEQQTESATESGSNTQTETSIDKEEIPTGTQTPDEETALETTEEAEDGSDNETTDDGTE